MIDSKHFGGDRLITVYTEESSCMRDEPSVEINWSAIGSVAIDRAKAFRDALNEAIQYAEEEAKRLGI